MAKNHLARKPQTADTQTGKDHGYRQKKKNEPQAYWKMPPLI